MTSRTTSENLVVTGLSRRLGEILILIAQGNNSKSVAKQLTKENGENLSPGTVDSYRRTLLYKIGAINTPDLIAKAFQSGTLRYLSLLIGLLIPLSGSIYVSLDNDSANTNRTASSRPRTSRARRTRSGVISLAMLTLDQMQDPENGITGEIVANWDAEYNDFYFSTT